MEGSDRRESRVACFEVHTLGTHQGKRLEVGSVDEAPACSTVTIVFGMGMPGISDMQSGSLKGLHLVVGDMAEAREALVTRGIEVGEVLDMQGVLYAQFSDPDGNLWLLQQFPVDYGR